MSSPSSVVLPGMEELDPPPGTEELLDPHAKHPLPPGSVLPGMEEPGMEELDPHAKPHPQPLDPLPPGKEELLDPHAKPQSDDLSTVMHKIKAVVFQGQRRAIVCQKEDGPCSLLAICNVLLLNNVIKLKPGTCDVSQEELISLVSSLLDAQQQAKERLGRLTGGLRMDMLLKNIDDFVSSPDQALIAELYIPMYHGWVVDPQNYELNAAIGKSSQFDLVSGRMQFETAVPPQGQGEDAVMSNENEEYENDKKKWVLIGNFLDNQHQLTEYGLACLQDQVPDNQLCIFFKNHHLNTMIKHNGRLYLLVTADAFREYTDVMWQSMDEVKAAGSYFTSNFTPWIEQEAVTAMKIDRTLPIGTNSGKMEMFDPQIVYGFVTDRDWAGLDGYLGKLLEPILQIRPHEAHPSLFMITRKEQLFDLIRDERLDDAADFLQNSLESLRGLQGRFTPFNIAREIDHLRSMVQTASVPDQRDTSAYIVTRISCYVKLYLNGLCKDANDADGLWQFVLKLPVPVSQTKKHNALLCLACCWESDGSHSISIMRSHILQATANCKGCSQVTQDMLDRLQATDPTKKVLSLEDIRNIFNGKRKTASISKVSAVAASMALNSGSASTSPKVAAGPLKKPRGGLVATGSKLATPPRAAPRLAAPLLDADLESKQKQMKEVMMSLQKVAGEMKDKARTLPTEDQPFWCLLALEILDQVLNLSTIVDGLGKD